MSYTHFYIPHMPRGVARSEWALGQETRGALYTVGHLRKVGKQFDAIYEEFRLDC